MHRKVTKFLSLFLSAAMMAGSLSVPAVAAEPAVYQESAAEETEALPEETEAEESGAEEFDAEESVTEETGSEEDAEQGEDQDTEDTVVESEDAEEVQEETADPEAADGTEESAEEEPAAEAEPAEAEDTALESEDTAQETTATEAVMDAEEVTGSNSDLTGQGYVLMNIPYADFFEAEGIDGVDIVSTATVKTYNQNMAGGSYHAGYEAADPISGAEILGVIYPVYVEDLSVLQGMTQVTDADTATITVAAGKSSTTTKEVSGKDLLFASGSYAFYILGQEPANYKTLSGSAGSYSFSAVKNGAQAAQIASANLTYGGHYTDLTLNVEADEVDDDAVGDGLAPDCLAVHHIAAGTLSEDALDRLRRLFADCADDGLDRLPSHRVGTGPGADLAGLLRARELAAGLVFEDLRPNLGPAAVGREGARVKDVEDRLHLAGEVAVVVPVLGLVDGDGGNEERAERVDA